MECLASKSRTGAIVLIAIGLLSFFEPLITTKPPVMGRAQWSLLDIVRQLQKGGLHTSAGNLVLPSISFGLPYLLMLFAFFNLCFFPAQKVLAWVGVIGAIDASLIFRFGDTDLERVFYGRCCLLPGPVKHFGLASVLLVVMIMLALLSMAEAPIPTARQGKHRVRWRLKPLK